MPRISSIVVLFVLALSLLAAACENGGDQTLPLARLEAEQAELDFGTVDQGAVVEARTTLRNTGDMPLVVGPFRVSCPCTAARVERSYLAPGDSTPLIITFETIGTPGADRQFISVFTDDSRLSPVVIALDGVVMPEYIVEPELHRIAYSKVGRIPIELRSTVRNVRDAPLTITAVKATGAGVTARLDGDARIPYTLPGKGDIAVVINATAGAADDPLNASVDLEFDQAQRKSIRVVLRQDTEPIIQNYRKALPGDTKPTPGEAPESGD